MQQIKVSDNFKKMTIKAIGAIILFIITYILLICLAISLTALCGFLSVVLISLTFNTATVMLSVGLISMGVLILIFLIKFIFRKHRLDRSHLTEIRQDQEPELFLLIKEIVREVNTDFPKRIYLSADVNASVFYDSNFWSMFLPIKKNLQIGAGLINSVSVIELRAILAHEFGHFSQRTMKVGSYVYNVNQVIYNMLYDNASYDKLSQKWAGDNLLLQISTGLAVKIIEAIQWVLKKVYDILNLSYMSLSREMEFHADEVAAHVTGSRPLVTSLLRMELADHSYNTVLSYYESKVIDSVKSDNVYSEQRHVMNFFAEKNKLPFENNLPQVSLEHLSRYNKSKLVISDQWASHPSTTERVLQLEKLNLETKNNNTEPASSLFSSINDLQAKLTDQLFSSIQYSTPPVIKTNEQFMKEFLDNHKKNSFNDIYNSYYDNKNPPLIDLEDNSTEEPQEVLSLADLFSNEAVDMVYTLIGLETDINTLQHISEGNMGMNSFDYDGTKYRPEDSVLLISSLTNKLEEIKETISRNDLRIYRQFQILAQKQGKENELQTHYEIFFKVDTLYEEKLLLYVEMTNTSYFMFQTTPFEVIAQNLKTLKEIEPRFKTEINFILAEKVFQDSITEEIKVTFDDYLSNNYAYFYDNDYRSAELNILFNSINHFYDILTKAHFTSKKKLLDYQVSIIPDIQKAF